MKELTPKAPEERVPLTFDFSDQLAEGESINSTPLPTVRALRGLDASASSRLSGPATVVDGAIVQQLFEGGVLGEVYEVRCKVTTNNSQILLYAALLPIRDPADT